MKILVAATVVAYWEYCEGIPILRNYHRNCVSFVLRLVYVERILKTMNIQTKLKTSKTSKKYKSKSTFYPMKNQVKNCLCKRKNEYIDINRNLIILFIQIIDI
jgi:hypothetical protein